MKINNQIIWAILGTILPAILNFSSVILAAKSSDAFSVGMAFTLIAALYIAIDLGNFGTTRMLLIEGAKPRTLRKLDLISGAISSVSFYIIYKALNFLEVSTIEITLALILLPPAAYSLSHSSLGILRTKNGNKETATIQLLCSLFRVVASAFLLKDITTPSQYCSTLLLVEIFYGVSLFLLSKKQTYSPPSIDNGASKENLKNMALASWSNNAAISFSKHFDIIIVTAIAGPISATLYRPLKSLTNIAHNLSYSLSIIYFSQERSIKSLSFIIYITLLSGLFFSAAISASSKYLPIPFPIAIKFNLSAFAFFGILSCTLTALNRFLQSRIFQCNKFSTYAKIAFLEALSSLALITTLTYFFSLTGSAIGLFLSSAIVLGLTLNIINKL